MYDHLKKKISMNISRGAVPDLMDGAPTSLLTMLVGKRG